MAVPRSLGAHRSRVAASRQAPGGHTGKIHSRNFLLAMRRKVRAGEFDRWSASVPQGRSFREVALARQRRARVPERGDRCPPLPVA